MLQKLEISAGLMGLLGPNADFTYVKIAVKNSALSAAFFMQVYFILTLKSLPYGVQVLNRKFRCIEIACEREMIFTCLAFSSSIETY